MGESPRPEERIAAAFNELFEGFEIRMGAEDLAIGTHRAIRHGGWLIIYRVDPNAGLPELELYATHRMTDDTHIRISADGRVEHLDAIYEAYVFDPKVPGSEEAAKEKYVTHNQAVANELRARGLYPDGDLNAFLRTGGLDEEGSSGSAAEEEGNESSA